LAQPGTRVYLVDDDAGVRRALTRVLRTAGHQTTAFGTAEDFLIGVELDDLPACLVVDLKMPGLSGLDLQELLLERGIELSLVFISGRADVQSGVQRDEGREPSTSWRSRSRTRRCSPPWRGASSRTARAASRRAERAQLQGRLGTLTPRERDVFGLIVTGLLNKQVGARLGTTEKTVKVHRSRVMQKMGAHSLAELVRMADKIAHRL
jgi:FixJ family two-component response regulator